MKTTYKVTGQLSYRGHQPGEVFEDELDEKAERRAIARGAISKTKAKPTTEEEGKTDA